MDNKRESNLWKQIDRLIFIIAVLGLIILVGAYFFVANLGNINPTLRELILNVITNIIPTSLLFIGAYLVLRHIEKLRSEKNTDEIAEKVISRLVEIAKVSADAEGEVDNPAKRPIKFSELHLKLDREFEIKVMPFQPKLDPQKLIVECAYRGGSTFLVKKTTFSGSSLTVKDDLIKYQLDNNGFDALIRNDRQIISSEQPLYIVELVLTAKWNKETIEKRLGNLGYLHFEIEHGAEVINLQKKI